MNGDIGEVRIRADRLVKRFGDFVAVNDVSFEARRGEIMGFLGPNGAGKSTTIRILCGLLRPSGGRAEVAGFDVARDPEKVRETIGYMSQKFSLYNDLSVRENLRFFGGIYGVKGARLRERFDFAVAMAGLEGREDAVVGDLSGGWKQRLALGCAVLHEPAILFLDEPTSGVDPASRRRFWDLIYTLAGEGVCFVITTHYMDEAEYCNRIALINGGRLVALGTPSELKRGAIRGEILLVEGEDARRDAGGASGRAGRARRRPVRLVAAHRRRGRGARPGGDRGAARRARPRLVADRADQGDARGRVRPARRRRRREGGRMTLRRIRAVARKEIIQILRDPRSLMVVLLMPLMQMALLGYGVNMDIKHVPICVFDREGSQQSEALLKAFQASQYFAIVETERDYAAVTRAIDAGRCKMAIVVPHDFSQNLAYANAASVQAILDATDDNTANIALGYAQAVVGDYSGNVQLERTQSMGLPQPVVPAVAQYRVWYNEDLVSRNYIMPGVVALVMALVGAQLTSLTISREWERGTMEVLVSTPVTRMELMAGKILPYFFIGLVDAALCLLIAVFWFEAPFRGAVSTLFLTTSLFLIVVLGLRLFHFRQHPQPGRREPDRARRDAPADHAALGLRLSDRADADADPVADLSRSGALLFRDPEIGVPQGQRARRPDRADRFARALRRGRRAPRRPGVSQDAGLGRCGAASSTWS